jgi:alpha-L-fucosidase 2
MDTTYLRETAYPIIKEAALFWTKNLTRYKNHFIVAPSISAEHGAFFNQRDSRSFSADSYGEIRYNIPGAIQDAQMIRDLFAMSICSAEILQIDHDFNKKLKTLSKKLVPNLIGKYGQLQEWQADIDSPEDHHRHIAHLYAVCPGNEIHPLITPKLADAAKVSLNLRGDGRYLTNDSASGGNWSMCWRIWCWARLMDGNRANKIFDQMLREQGFENLLTFQPAGYSMGRPDLYRETENLFLHFQLDASASTPGFMAEMLLQSHLDQIILLPALPDEWKDGTVTGLLARGGHKVDIQWKDGELVKAVITTAGKIPVIRVKDKIVTRGDDRIEIRKNRDSDK